MSGPSLRDRLQRPFPFRMRRSTVDLMPVDLLVFGRHPDHRAASDVLSVAAFRSGLRRYESSAAAWRPDWICYYFINDGATPSFVIDVSDCYEHKRQALACYASQFSPENDSAVQTRLTAPTFRQLIESRDAQFGALAGVRYAEGVVVKEPLLRTTLLK